MPLKTRILYLILSWLPAGLAYIIGGCMKGDAWIVSETRIDELVPFKTAGIWIYLLFYIYIPFTFVYIDESKVKRISLAFIICSFISGVVFFLYPTTVLFPPFEINGISDQLLNFVVANDTELNCFPSLHGSLITICTMANWNKQRKGISYGFIFFSIIMYYSILLVKRHLFIDLAAGIILAILTWLFSKYILGKTKK